MTKLEQAATLALEALEELHYSSGTVVAARMYEIATAALREALAEQAEQDAFAASGKPIIEPVTQSPAYCTYPHCDCINGTLCRARNAAPVQQAEQEPVGYFAYDEEHDIWEELTGPNAPGATPLYTAPARTKDLTKEEIQNAMMPIEPTGKDYFLRLARAVIAKFKEKNK